MLMRYKFAATSWVLSYLSSGPIVVIMTEFIFREQVHRGESSRNPTSTGTKVSPSLEGSGWLGGAVSGKVEGVRGKIIGQMRPRNPRGKAHIAAFPSPRFGRGPWVGQPDDISERLAFAIHPAT